MTTQDITRRTMARQLLTTALHAHTLSCWLLSNQPEIHVQSADSTHWFQHPFLTRRGQHRAHPHDMSELGDTINNVAHAQIGRAASSARGQLPHASTASCPAPLLLSWLVQDKSAHGNASASAAMLAARSQLKNWRRRLLAQERRAAPTRLSVAHAHAVKGGVPLRKGLRRLRRQQRLLRK